MSLKTRAKKYIASKLSASKTGRSVVGRLAGEDGMSILNTLKSSTKKISGPNAARDIKVHITKIATKVGVLVQDEVLGPDDFEPARETVVALLDLLQEALRNSSATAELTPLADSLRQCGDALVPILAPHMKRENADRVQILATYFSSPDFMEPFFRGQHYAVDREALLHSIESLLSPFQDELNEAKRHHVDLLTARRDRLRNALRTENIDVFLQLDETRKALQDWIMSHEPTDGRLVPFWVATKDYAAISNRGLMERRANNVFDKFLDGADGNGMVNQGNLGISPEVVDQIADAIRSGDVRRTLFQPAVAEVNARLMVHFTGAFRTSDELDALVDTVDKLAARIHVHRASLANVDPISIRVSESEAKEGAPGGLDSLATLALRDSEDVGDEVRITEDGYAVTQDGLYLAVEANVVEEADEEEEKTRDSESTQ